MLWSLDIWLLVRFERLADFTHEWFGYGAPSWERACLAASIPLALMQHSVSPWIVAFDVVWSCFLFIRVDDTAPISETATRNPKKLVLQPVRAFSIGFLAFDLVTSTFGFHPVLWFWAIVPSMYFEACDRKPPRTSRVKQALRKLISAKGPQPVAVGSR